MRSEFLHDLGVEPREETWRDHRAFVEHANLTVPDGLPIPTWAHDVKVGSLLWPNIDINVSSRRISSGDVSAVWGQLTTISVEDEKMPDGSTVPAGTIITDPPALYLSVGELDFVLEAADADLLTRLGEVALNAPLLLTEKVLERRTEPGDPHAEGDWQLATTDRVGVDA